MIEGKRLAAALVVTLASNASSHAETTVSLHGIHTRIGAIDTHVDRVSFSDPELVALPGVGYAYKMHGTVSGVGWGGITGIVPRAINAHYTYDVTFVARWPADGGDGTVVMYHHGGGPTAIVLAQRDLRDGAGNVNRFSERLGDNAFGIPALLNRAAYISTNRRGLVGNGGFAAKFLPSEVAPLTQAEADAANAAIGGAGHPDIFAGAPVPAVISLDVATLRDVDRALQKVVGKVSGESFRRQIFIGNSSGSVLGKGMAFGCSVIGTSCVRTGGNHLVPYTSSPLIFDGFIFTGFPYIPGFENADAQQPFSAPAVFLQGRADDRYQFPVAMSAELKQKGVQLDGSVWIYEIANQPHVARDNLLEVFDPSREAEPMGPYVSAAIRNLRDFLDSGAAMPRSHIDGRIVDDRLRFDVAGGTTNMMPVREDPALDTVEVALNIVPRTTDAAGTDLWRSVTEALPHENHEIVGPTIACRVGKYMLRFGGALLTPFSPAELAVRFGSFDGYRECVSATLDGLDAERLYDLRVESAAQHAARASSLFAPL